MVGVVILPRMRRQFGGQLHFVAQATSEPEAAGQLARVWHDGDETLLQELVGEVCAMLSSASSVLQAFRMVALIISETSISTFRNTYQLVEDAGGGGGGDDEYYPLGYC